MTDRIDEKGFFILKSHAEVTFLLEGIKEVHLMDVDKSPAIIGSLDISRSEEQVAIEWDASYGVYGRIKASRVSISLVPGKPD
jgi:hypothetical protein